MATRPRLSDAFKISDPAHYAPYQMPQPVAPSRRFGFVFTVIEGVFILAGTLGMIVCFYWLVTH